MFISRYLRSSTLPLSNVRVLELGPGLLAGGWTGCLLGGLGAQVIKIEHPHIPDGIRQWREVDSSGTSLWWHSIARNKKSLALDYKRPRGLSILKELIKRSDVIVENFKPGGLDRLGLNENLIRQSNPNIVICRVSGFGQDGPYSTRPGFASICEAMAGFRSINGYEDRPPVRPNLSLGDSLTALHAVIGVLASLYGRDRQLAHKSDTGESRSSTPYNIDASIFESIFSLLESSVSEYDRLGIIREPSGATLTGIVPSNTYQSIDNQYVVIAANTTALFRRLMTTIGRVDLSNDESLSTNNGRVIKQTIIDDAIMQWTSTRRLPTIMKELESVGVPVGSIKNIEDLFNDPHVKDRQMIESIRLNDSSELKIPSLHPRINGHPLLTGSCGPDLGQHSREILRLLERSEEEINELIESQVVVQTDEYESQTHHDDPKRGPVEQSTVSSDC